jgi:maleate isomerase
MSEQRSNPARKLRIGMVVPSLNTIAEDDFRTYCPREVGYHVHRVRLRKRDGRVPMESLVRAYLEAGDAVGYLHDMEPDAIVFNCTGASVAYGASGDVAMASQLSAELGVPVTNTMLAIKQALRALSAGPLLHVCPFADEFSRIEREALQADGFQVQRTVSLGVASAQVAARMSPAQIRDLVHAQLEPGIGAVLLSCANVRAFEAAAALERELSLPVVTSNQAVLWWCLALAGWRGRLAGAGRLFEVAGAAGPMQEAAR